MKPIKTKLVGCMIILLLAICTTPSLHAFGKTVPEPILDPKYVRMTYYTPTGSNCANGMPPYEGAVAYMQEYITYGEINYVAILYSVRDDGSIGDRIGFFDVCDTGHGYTQKNGKGSIKNGNTIDVFRNSEQSGQQWVAKYGDYCYIQILKSVG